MTPIGKIGNTERQAISILFTTSNRDVSVFIARAPNFIKIFVTFAMTIATATPEIPYEEPT